MWVQRFFLLVRPAVADPQFRVGLLMCLILELNLAH